MAAVSAVVLFGSIPWTQAANYYINASGPAGDGSGSSVSNAADASSASKYGAIVNAQSSSGTTIVYGAGTYQVNPTLPMYNGVAHQGAGMDKTILQITNGVLSTGSNGASQIFRSSGSTTSWFRCLDVTVDFNCVNQPAWSNHTMASAAFCFTTADHCTIQRVKFINIGSQGAESFPIFFILGNSANGNLNNNLIDSCIFTQPVKSGNVHSGLTCIYMGDALPNITVDNTNIVSNCQFINLKYPEYSDIQYTNSVTAPVVRNCYCRGVDELWGCEPGSQNNNNGSMFTGQTCQVTGNTLVNTGSLGGILLHPDSNGAFGSVNIQYNTASLDQHPYQFLGSRGPQFFLIQTAGGIGTSTIGNVTIQNNTVRAPPSPWTANPRLVITISRSPSLFHVNSLTVSNNNLIDFPGDGSELEVNKAQIGTYTNTGNTFGSPPRPDRPPHQSWRHHQTPVQ